jgi:hypothetical protein
MSVDGYYDSPNSFSAKDPGTAIAILSESHPGYLVRHGFVDMYRGQRLPRAATLNGADAIVMMGTTAELQNDLRWAVQYGLAAIEIPNDYLAVWYVRRSTTDKTKTVVSIAPLQRYWGNSADPYNRNWRNLYANQVFNGGISLQTLADHILPTAQGQRAGTDSS